MKKTASFRLARGMPSLGCTIQVWFLCQKDILPPHSSRTCSRCPGILYLKRSHTHLQRLGAFPGFAFSRNSLFGKGYILPVHAWAKEMGRGKRSLAIQPRSPRAFMRPLEMQDGTRVGLECTMAHFCYTLDVELQNPRILNSNQCFSLSRKKARTYLRVYWLYLQHLNILTYSMRASICTLSWAPKMLGQACIKMSQETVTEGERIIKRKQDSGNLFQIMLLKSYADFISTPLQL